MPAFRSARERFDEKWKRAENECWLWVGSLRGGGVMRGSFALNHGKKLSAHRAAWVLYRGEIPAGHEIRLLCDTALCVNPDHLKPMIRTIEIARGHY